MELPEPVLARLADEVRIVRACAESGSVRFEHRDVTAAARQGQRAGQAAPEADDSDVGLGRKESGRFIRAWRSAPPPSRGAAIFGEGRVGHAAAIDCRAEGGSATTPPPPPGRGPETAS